MGITPLEGLMMGTRSGSIDPGILFRLLRRRLDRSPTSRPTSSTGPGCWPWPARPTWRDLRERERRGDAAARLAIEMFVGRAAAGIAAAATALPTLDGSSSRAASASMPMP